MTPTFQFDTKKFESDLRQLAIVNKREFNGALRQQAKLLVQDAMKMTPPFNGKEMEGVTKQSWAVQKQAGVNAVTLAVKRLFTVLDESKLGVFGESIRKQIRSGNIAEARKLLDRFKIRGEISTATDFEALHRKYRNKNTGRVAKNARVICLDKTQRDVDAYAKKASRSVGKGKAGWLLAAGKLGLKVGAKWITNHSGMPGLFAEESSKDKLVITVGNKVPHVQRAGRDENIMAVALKIRATKLEADLKRTIERVAKWANRK